MQRLFILLGLIFVLSACSAPKTPDAPSTPSGSITPVSSSAPDVTENEVLNVTVMKGATGLGMLSLMDKTDSSYNFSIAGTPDQVSTSIINGETDIAAVPCNLASILFNKTQGKVKVIAVNTLGVLYMLENGNSIQTIEDLKGKTIETTGKGTTPEYTLQHILKSNGLENDVTVEFKSESTELASLLISGQTKLAMLPEPFVTTVLLKNTDVRIALDMTKEWEKLDNSQLVTGVIIARESVSQDSINSFLADYKESITNVNANIENTATLSEKFDIMPAATVKQALPRCNIVFVDGQQMKDYISNYLSILFEMDATSVGGALPDEGFYYIG